ncbi:MAG: hypothetical protein R3E83_12495 [Burkholderiaceae bacterium]
MPSCAWALRENGSVASRARCQLGIDGPPRKGVAWAQYRLATQLEAGNGVAADKVQAYRWMLLASRGADAQRGPWNLDAAITRLRSALAPGGT